jgi:hypothetical protein
MYRHIMQNHKKFTGYSIYLLIILSIMDILSTYIGITYFNAYEANTNTARLFEAFGMLIPSLLKIFTIIILGQIIRLVLKKSEPLLHNSNGWVSQVAIFSTLNTILIIITLNVIYFVIVLHNIHIIYGNF